MLHRGKYQYSILKSLMYSGMNTEDGTFVTPSLFHPSLIFKARLVSSRFGTTKFSIMTFIIMDLIVTLSIKDTRHEL